MLDPTYVRDHAEEVRAGLQHRGLKPDAELEQLATLEARRRRLIPELEGLKREQNAAGDQVARAKRQGQDASSIFAANKTRAQHIRQIEIELDQVEHQRSALLLTLPNLPHASVPVGTTAEENQEVRRHGTLPTFDFDPKPHWELGAALGILDFERATKMSGSRFAVLSGAGARLSRALINFMLDLHTREHGYTEIEPPFLVNSEALRGTGNLPKFEQDLFKIAGDWDLYLIPTAEVPFTNLHRGEILDGRLLPLLYTAYTPCFRSEAGSYGKDVRGLIRQHQFDKVETREVHDPGPFVRGARGAHGERRGGAETPRAAVSHGPALHRRHGLRVRQDLRHRSVAAEPAGLPRDFVLQQYRGLPGAAREHQVPAAGDRQGRVRPHLERLRSRRRADHRSPFSKTASGRTAASSFPRRCARTWAASRSSSRRLAADAKISVANM